MIKQRRSKERGGLIISRKYVQAKNGKWGMRGLGKSFIGSISGQKDYNSRSPPAIQ